MPTSNSTTPLLGGVQLARSPFLWRSGAILAVVGVVAGAFGSHALRGRLDPTDSKMHAWETASHYALFNGIALLAVSLHPRFSSHKVAGLAILAGTTVFSGSIMALILGGDRFKWLGPVTPLGGLSIITGYVALAL